MPLFKIKNDKAVKLSYNNFNKERQVQTLFESNMSEMLGLRFIKSEHVTTDGRIDSLAIDENGNPVIVEYKLTKNENVLSQGLFYTDWLVTHKGDFEVLVQKTMGSDVKVSWSNPKLIIIASDYSRYDKHAVNVIKRDISLFKYYLYEDDMLYLERINTDSGSDVSEPVSSPSKKEVTENSLESLQKSASTDIIELFNELKERILALDDSISERITGIYVAYRASRNFVEIYFKNKLLQLQLLPTVNDERGLGKKVPDSYAWTLNYRVDISSFDNIDYVMDLIEQSYNKTK